MSEKDQTPPKTDFTGTGDTTAILKLDDDIEFPGELNATPKSTLGPGAYNIFIPATVALGTTAEFEQVRAFCAELEALEKAGSITRLGVTDGVWNITFSLDSGGKKLTNEIVRSAFTALKPKLESAELLQTGFVQDALPFWKLMNGTKVERKGNFKKKA